MELFAYFRSSAAYRVRIALALKAVPHTITPVNLVSGEQRSDAYLDTNPQGLVPALRLDSGEVIGQSMAILEWLEEAYPRPALYPDARLERARYRALCQHIACDIHPLNNLRVLAYLREELGQHQAAVDRWYAHWIHTGFIALESAVAQQSGPFSLGDDPGLLEVLLVPQVYNARRFKVDLSDFPAIVALDTRCHTIEALRGAHPSVQPDTPASERS